ncbi:DUF4129 domain-containing protein [Zunongwangia sp. F363]|uniref:DUF4129 domain-containing protein n=1 Tax=Autumnicola tepida TaxID=3075595 RepID=A0ABU3CA63_9FLAO|nr:DUF4129 domain-containing protein [Zunongwangia sp. F363]MDT0643221.1 DUF4129 domain-containing protein [Zunongwangia sp. F363]
MQRLILAILLSFFCFGKALPQQESAGDSIAEIKYDHTPGLQKTSFDEEQIEDYKEQPEFEYLNQTEEDSWWTRFKKWLNLKYNQLLEWLFGDYTPGGILQFLITVLPYLVLAAVLGFIFWLITKLDPGSSLLESPAESQVFLSEEEEIIQSKDISKLIEEAIENHQYRLAVRYYYLYNLKKLDAMGFISYQFQKTNEDYSGEIYAETVKQQFRKITRLYDFIWYGDFKVSETEFRLAEKGFVQMDNLLKKKANE